MKRLMFLKLAGTAMAELGMPRSGRAKVSESCLRAASELRLAGMNLTELGPCNLGVSERALMLCDFILIRGLESLPLRGGAVNRKGIREIWTSPHGGKSQQKFPWCDLFSAAVATPLQPDCTAELAQSTFSPPTSFPEHARIICKRHRFLNDYSAELWMRRVDKPIVLGRCKDGGRQQQTGLSLSDEFIADRGELRRYRRSSPIRRQEANFDEFPGQIIGHFRYSQDEIEGRIVLIEVDKILQ